MSFYHGVEVKQIQTSIIPPRKISASIPVFIGCAPIHRITEQAQAAKNGDVVLCHRSEERRVGKECRSWWST